LKTSKACLQIQKSKIYYETVDKGEPLASFMADSGRTKTSPCRYLNWRNIPCTSPLRTVR